MKRRVHIFAIVRVPVDIDDATSAEDSITKAEEQIEKWGNLPFRGPDAEDACGRDGYVVDILDEQGKLDEEEGSFKSDGVTRTC